MAAVARSVVIIDVSAASDSMGRFGAGANSLTNPMTCTQPTARRFILPSKTSHEPWRRRCGSSERQRPLERRSTVAESSRIRWPTMRSLGMPITFGQHCGRRPPVRLLAELRTHRRLRCVNQHDTSNRSFGIGERWREAPRSFFPSLGTVWPRCLYSI